MTAEEMKQAVERLSKMKGLSERRMEFFRICQNLAEAGDDVVREIVPLLDDWDFEIRKETGFWLEARGFRLVGDRELALEYALLQFENLKWKAEKDGKARAYLFKALQDRSPRVREKVFRIFSLSDCRDEKEVLIYLYGRGEYLELIKFAKEKGLEKEAERLLREGMKDERNVPHQQRQCAFALRQLGFDVEVIRKKAEEGTYEGEATAGKVMPETSENALERFLAELNRQGIRTGEGILYPKIQIGSVTGRITYREPGIQTWPHEKRVDTIRPREGYRLWRFDFREIEPRILCHFLVEGFWLSLEDIPEGDLYGLAGEKNRDRAKVLLNKIINGGMVLLPEDAPGRLKRFKAAVDQYRLELLERAKKEGWIETLGGRKIEISGEDREIRRRVMSYKIQGSAADFFNEAVVALNAYLSLERIDARIVFLLYDEVWIEIEESKEEEIAGQVADFLDHVGDGFHLFLPIPIRSERLS